CLRLPAYSASAKVICFMEKLGWRDRRISPDSGSLFQTFLSDCQLWADSFPLVTGRDRPSAVSDMFTFLRLSSALPQ
ncbi:hypothetical protein, partial [Stutzerimonas kunmingensis]